MNNLRRKYYRLSIRSQHNHIRLNHNENTCQQRHLRRQIKIHMNGSNFVLPEQSYGQGQIYHDPAFNDTTRICRKYIISQKNHTTDTSMQG